MPGDALVRIDRELLVAIREKWPAYGSLGNKALVDVVLRRALERLK